MGSSDDLKPRSYTMKHPILYHIIVATLLLYFLVTDIRKNHLNNYFQILFFIIVIQYFIYIISNLYSITYDDTSVTKKGLFRVERTIHWNEIREIKAGTWSRVITLMDGHGNKLLALNDNCYRFEHFVNFLSQKCPNLYRPSLDQPIKANYKNLISHILFYIIIIMVPMSILGKGTLIEKLIVSGTVSGILIILLFSQFLFYTQEIILKKDRLLLRYLKKNKEIQIKDIKSIEYKYTSSNKGQRYYHNIITTHHGEDIKIKFLGMNGVILYQYLHNWFEENRRGLDDQTGNRQ